MIKYPSIDAFRHAVKLVQLRTWYSGKDENGEPIYDQTKPLPTLQFRGYTKIHGTNAAISYDCSTKEYAYQSRTRVITPEDDNMGFAEFIQTKHHVIDQVVDAIPDIIPELNLTKVVLYGEYCGEGIMKGTAINQLTKRFVVFGVKVFTEDQLHWLNLDDDGSFWIDPMEFKVRGLINWPEDHVYNVAEFGCTVVDIDFNEPEKAQDQLTLLTNWTEECCPVGKYFGVEGIGEGIVWTCIDPSIDYEIQFKTKGDKHKVTKTKKDNPISPEEMESIQEFVDSVVTEQRLEWALDNLLNEQKKPLEESSIGDFIKTVRNDIVKEESDTMEVSGIDHKKLGRHINAPVREWFKEKCKSTF